MRERQRESLVRAPAAIDCITPAASLFRHPSAWLVAGPQPHYTLAMMHICAVISGLPGEVLDGHSGERSYHCRLQAGYRGWNQTLLFMRFSP